MSSQTTFLDQTHFNTRKSFGGSLLKNSHAKIARPLSSKQALHVVLKPNTTKGPRSLLLRERLLHNLILKQGRLHNVKVFRVINSGDHIQILLRFTQRRQLHNFFRSLCGLIARKTLNSERGRPSREGQSKKFWAQRPFTRILSWGPDFNNLQKYFDLKKSQLTWPSFGFVESHFVKNLGIIDLRKRILEEISTKLGIVSNNLTLKNAKTS